MSRIAPKRDTEEIDTVAMSSRQFGDRRAFDVLMEAQQHDGGFPQGQGTK